MGFIFLTSPKYLQTVCGCCWIRGEYILVVMNATAASNITPTRFPEFGLLGYLALCDLWCLGE